FCYFPQSAYIYTLSLHDALPIFIFLSDLCVKKYSELAFIFYVLRQYDDFLSFYWGAPESPAARSEFQSCRLCSAWAVPVSSQLIDRKSTRLNSSHVKISYAVFCL